MSTVELSTRERVEEQEAKVAAAEARVGELRNERERQALAGADTRAVREEIRAAEEDVVDLKTRLRALAERLAGEDEHERQQALLERLAAMFADDVVALEHYLVVVRIREQLVEAEEALRRTAGEKPRMKRLQDLQAEGLDALWESDRRGHMPGYGPEVDGLDSAGVEAELEHFRALAAKAREATSQ